MNYCLFVGSILSIGEVVYFNEKATCEFIVRVLKYVPTIGGEPVYDDITIKTWKEMADHVIVNYSVGDIVRIECKLGVFSGIGKDSGKPYKIMSLDLKNIIRIDSGNSQEIFAI